MIHLRSAAAGVAFALLLGCVDGTLPKATSPSDPSNPDAPESPLPAARMLGTAQAPQSPAGISPAAPVSYVCPMHPAIVRDVPGTCPICGMTLVARPKAPEAPSPPRGAL